MSERFPKLSTDEFAVLDAAMGGTEEIQGTAREVSQRPAGPPLAAPGEGRRLAICVGIDTYPTAPLTGCVADANLWAATLRDLHYTTAVLANARATRAAILSSLEALVTRARPGDVIAFQYSGHGTQVPDLDGDERDRQDEAMCPYDFASGRLLVDDDLGAIMQQVPAGVNVTCFIDCCHSGTINRLAVAPAAVPGPEDRRPRFIVATPELIEAHARFRQSLPRSRRGPRAAAMREVLFAACEPDEVAWESHGQGDFTRKAARLLPQAAGRLSNEEFQQAVSAALGPAPRQHPMLTCAPGARAHGLLASVVAAV